MTSIHESIRIAIVTSSLVSTNHAVMFGARDAAVERKWRVQFIEADKFLSITLKRWNPQVVIVCPSMPPNLKSLPLGTRTVVAAGFEMDGMSCVVPDDNAVGRAAGEHLLEVGITHVGVIKPPGHVFAETRATAMCNALTAAGCKCSYFEGSPWTPRRLTAARIAITPKLVRWIKDLPVPAGLFVPCDMWAPDIMSQIAFTRRRIPEDMAIVAADNFPFICEMVRPELTSVNIPWGMIGKEAVRLAADLMDSKRLHRITKISIGPTGVERRRSSDLVAVSNPDVASAIKFIRAHLKTNVTEVARAVAVPQRTLERAFMETLDRTVIREIIRCRIHHAKHLLTTSSKPIAQIATECGFSSATRFGETFRRECGYSPHRFRMSKTSIAAVV